MENRIPNSNQNVFDFPLYQGKKKEMIKIRPDTLWKLFTLIDDKFEKIIENNFILLNLLIAFLFSLLFAM